MQTLVDKKIYIEEFVPSNEHAAEIIGFKGYKVKRISQETHTYIQCPSPSEPPIFKIYGDNRRSVDIAKEKIRESVLHFDEMRNKKRQIRLKIGEKLETVWFKKSDIPCIIGRKGRQVKRLMNLTNVTVISPDTNKEAIFIICGREGDIKACVLIMKIIAFCVSGMNYFNPNEMSLIYDFLNYNCKDLKLFYSIHSLVNVKSFKEKFLRLNRQQVLLELPGKLTLYMCWNCKNQSIKIARTLCHHIISCDSCVVQLYADIYLKCKACGKKVENFLIEFHHEFSTLGN